MARNRILLVEDEPGIRFAIRDFLDASGYRVDEADGCQKALELFLSARPDAVVLDYMLPDGNALELLPKLKDIDGAVPLIILSGHGSIDVAVQAVKEGAEQFLTKPLQLSALAVVLERSLENRRHRQRSLAEASKGAAERPDPFLGTSPAVRELAERARRAAAAEAPVLVLGETGSGKGVLARWIHDNGPRADETFVDLNCAGLTKDFLETELFGHERGAFTGAATSKMGLLEVADRGTAFLDEIGDVDPAVQPKLLKVLEEKRFRRMGEVKDRLVDVRLVAATHQDLGTAVSEKRFRADLFFRISTLPLNVPPLRTRGEDIPVLAGHLLRRIGADLGRGEVGLEPDAVRLLQAYHWPGNIRELKNVLERAVLLGGDRPALRKEDLRFDFAALPAAAAAEVEDESNLTLRELEQRHIARVLKAEKGNVGKAAQRLGIPRSTLYQRIKTFGMEIPHE